MYAIYLVLLGIKIIERGSMANQSINQFKKGILPMLILQIISDEKDYGYNIVNRFKEKVGESLCNQLYASVHTDKLRSIRSRQKTRLYYVFNRRYRTRKEHCCTIFYKFILQISGFKQKELQTCPLIPR